MLANKGFGGDILIDISKACSTIYYDLLITKLNVDGFLKESLKLIKSLLTNRWQRTTLNKGFSKWIEILLVVPDGSVLGPLLFNIFIKTLFFCTENTNVCNHADDTAFYACESVLHNLISRLVHDSVLAIEWYEHNYMKLSHDKCHSLILDINMKVCGQILVLAKFGKAMTKRFLDLVNIDYNLKFSYYNKKAGRKLILLTTIGKFMSLKRQKILMKSLNRGLVRILSLSMDVL